MRTLEHAIRCTYWSLHSCLWNHLSFTAIINVNTHHDRATSQKDQVRRGICRTNKWMLWSQVQEPQQDQGARRRSQLWNPKNQGNSGTNHLIERCLFWVHQDICQNQLGQVPRFVARGWTPQFVRHKSFNRKAESRWWTFMIIKYGNGPEAEII